MKNKFLRRAICLALMTPVCAGLVTDRVVAVDPMADNQIWDETYDNPTQDLTIIWPATDTHYDGSPIRGNSIVNANSVKIENHRTDYDILSKGIYADSDNTHTLTVTAKSIDIMGRDDGVYSEGNGSALLKGFDTLKIAADEGYGIVNNNNITNTSGGNGRPMEFIGNTGSTITISSNGHRPAINNNSATSNVTLKAGTIDVSTSNKAGSGNGLAAGGTVTTAFNPYAVGGTVIIDGDTLVKITNTAGSAAVNAYIGEIDINQNTSGTLQLTGDALASNKGIDNLNFAGKDSFIQGNMKASNNGTINAVLESDNAYAKGNAIAEGGTVNVTYAGAEANHQGNINATDTADKKGTVNANFTGEKASMAGDILAGVDGGTTTTTIATTMSGKTTTKSNTTTQSASGGVVSAQFSGADAALKGNIAAKGIGTINADFTGVHSSMVGDISAGTGPSSVTTESDGGIPPYFTTHTTAVTDSEGGNGVVNANFTGSDSSLTGKVTTIYHPVDDSLTSEAATNLVFSNGSRWNMTADSNVTKLTNDASTVNMQASGVGNYETLTTKNYGGSGGTMLMDTDLASQIDGDKLVITDGSTAGTTAIQVSDSSLKTGAEVTGPKHLLLVTGASSGTTFVGKSLDAGGLWETTPDIKNGTQVVDETGNVIGQADEWYLDMLKKKPNPATREMIDSFGESYSFWRNILTDDTLRQRLGDLRYDEKAAGLWTRIKGGQINGAGYDNDYVMYQIGYDKIKENTAYGLAFDYARGFGAYPDGGASDTRMGMLSLYATNYRNGYRDGYGTYSDVVLKLGKQKNDMRNYGEYPDAYDYGSWGVSASYEMGKTIALDKGWFVEPEGQLVFGHLDKADFTTNRGTVVHKDGVNSVLGRLGVVLGRKMATKDYYFKFNAWHDFGGSSDADLFAANGERMYRDDDFGGTFYEFGVGGNIVINDGTHGTRCHLYGDVLRMYGNANATGWQANAGLRWEFN